MTGVHRPAKLALPPQRGPRLLCSGIHRKQENIPTAYPGCIFHPASQKGISFSADLPHLGWSHERDVSFMAGDAKGAAGTVSAFRAPTDNNGLCLLDFITQNQNHPAEENLKQINLCVLFFTPFLILSLANDSGVTQTRTPRPLSPALGRSCTGTSSFSSRRRVPAAVVGLFLVLFFPQMEYFM